MAKIKFGMMMTDASGKLGGQVFAKNRGGNYVRTKGIPTNPQSVFQTAIRAIFATVSSGWSALTAAQIASWNGAVTAFARTDVFGDLRNPSGKALYQRLNTNLLAAGGSALTVCPQPIAVPSPDVLTAAGDVSDTQLSLDINNALPGAFLQISATPPQSNGTSFVKNDFRVVKTIFSPIAGEQDVWAEYTARFGAPVAGDNIFLGARVITATGQASPLQTIKVVVTA
jgi:hypothetical protein